jgi:hypothetical protein
MEGRPFLPARWAKVVLAILPGLFALARSGVLLALPGGAGTADRLSLIGLATVCTALVIAGLARERRLPAWSYPALGILLGLLSAWWWVPLTNVLITVPRIPSGLWRNLAPVFEFAVLAAIAAPITYRVGRRRGIHVPKLGCALLGLIILLVVAEVFIASVAGAAPYQRTTPLGLAWYGLWRMGAALLLVAIGLPLGWRSGTSAGLIVVAYQYVRVEDVVACVMANGRPVYGICVCMARQAPVILLGGITVLLLLILPPVWVLRSRSSRQRIWGLAAPPILVVVTGAAIGLIICRGTPSEYWIGWWFAQLMAGAWPAIGVGLAAVVYHSIERQGIESGTQEATGD